MKNTKRRFNLILQISLLIIAALSSLYIIDSYSSAGRIITEEQIIPGAITVNNKTLAAGGFTLYPIDGNAQIHLINQEGKSVHHWDFDAERARLLPNCNLLVKPGSDWGRTLEKWNGIRNKLIELDWDGNIVWSYTADDNLHHDFQLTENGNLIALKREFLPESYKSKISDPQKRLLKIRSDAVIEFNRQGKMQYTWLAHDHLDLNSCGRRSCLERVGDDTGSRNAEDWTHMNTLSLIPENHWYKNGDQRFRPGNFFVMPRNFWTAYLIDKNSGKVLWEYGGDYKGGLSGGHEVQMIPEGYPGAGNILMLDNGANHHYGESYILEIDPQTNKLVWVYDVGPKFWTRTKGSVQRLKNGNTFISEDLTGRVFEVTPLKETAWEYRGNLQINRAKRYESNYCPKFAGL